MIASSKAPTATAAIFTVNMREAVISARVVCAVCCCICTKSPNVCR